LWQFKDADMGLSYGQAEIVQATFKWEPSGSTSGSLQTRAVAILPGGKGRKAPAGTCLFNQTFSMKQPDGNSYTSRTDDEVVDSKVDHRPAVPCWETAGRALYFVDVETGQLIKKVFDNDTDTKNGIFLPSPIVGTPTAYLDSVGTTADRGWVMDADGVLWRFDISSQDPDKDNPEKGWTMRPFHDLFWDKKAAALLNDGETTYERPVLTVDEQRRVVVLVGTGDTDNFEKKTADNRIVSLTEVLKKEPATTPEHYGALVNWELRNENRKGNSYAMYPSEMVTGSMALFDGVLYAATFISDVGGTDSCEYGRGRLWSLDYRQADKSWDLLTCDGCEKAPYHGPTLIKPVAVSSADNDNDKFNLTFDQAIPNMLVQGIGTTQRPACTPEEKDPLNTYFSPVLPSLAETSPPAIWVVAQASGGKQRGGSRMGGVQGEAGRKPLFSRVTSWATSVD
jgi:hypothetical protein